MTTPRPDHLLRASLLHEAGNFDRQPYEEMVRRMYKNAEEPEDIAEAVAFLASEQARKATGSVLVVDGGQLVS